MPSIMGFLGAAVSGATLKLAQIAPEGVRSWMETGGTIGLVGCLSYAVLTLWRRLNQRDADIADLNREIRTDWKTQNQRLIDVLDKLDRDKDR